MPERPLLSVPGLQRVCALSELVQALLHGKSPDTQAWEPISALGQGICNKHPDDSLCKPSLMLMW